MDKLFTSIITIIYYSLPEKKNQILSSVYKIFPVSHVVLMPNSKI